MSGGGAFSSLTPQYPALPAIKVQAAIPCYSTKRKMRLLLRDAFLTIVHELYFIAAGTAV
jgi:hypothetical protein